MVYSSHPSNCLDCFSFSCYSRIFSCRLEKYCTRFNYFWVRFTFLCFVFLFFGKFPWWYRCRHYHDGRSKDMNLSHQPLVTKEISILQAKLFCLLFLVDSLLCTLSVGFYFVLVIIILDVIGYVYSLEPFRMKKRPIGDVMCNALLGVFFSLQVWL